MAIKKFFTGKTGCLFWFNVLLAAVVVIAVPVATFHALGYYTHHGEKITVPNVIGKSEYEAKQILENEGLSCVISDSIYKKGVAPGSILDQSPKTGICVKSGRIVYLTMNLVGEPLVKMPDLTNNASVRIAEAQLTALGFKIAPIQYVEGFPQDLVITIKQGNREIHAGERISKDRALTIIAGAGDPRDTIFEDEIMEDVAIGIADSTGERSSHFNVDL